MEKLNTDQTKKNAKGEVGIVRGLAWTQAGGDTLEIEVITMPGKGEFKLTGNMGDVMKESASIAVSYIRSVTEKGRYKVDAEYFQNHAFHLHIPEGATRKTDLLLALQWQRQYCSGYWNSCKSRCCNDWRAYIKR